DAWDAMPWVLNGRADEAQSERLHRHLQHCTTCREEWAFQQQLHGALTRAPRPVEDMLARFWAEAPHGDAEEAPVAAAEPVAAGAPLPQSPRPRWALPGLALVLALAAAGLGRLSAPSAPGPDYRLLSEAGAPSPASLRLVPAPGLTLAELQALLAREGLQIVEASPEGRHFGLAAAPGGPAGAPVEIAARLRSQPGVLLAEPLR
ncbi:MAG: hypothetical protein ACOVRP_10505, partial [Gemmatimonas sp.]